MLILKNKWLHLIKEHLKEYISVMKYKYLGKYEEKKTLL